MPVGEPIGAARAALIAALLVASCGDDASSGTVIDELSQPRGIALDGSTVCIAEAGSIPPGGATVEREGQLEAETGRVLCRHDDGGDVEVVLDGLPFVYYPDAAVTSGAADVLFDGDDLYVLIGEAYGDRARSVVRASEQGPEPVADLVAFAQERSEADGGALRSNPWSMVDDRDGDGFLIADAATGAVLRVGFDGGVELWSAVPGHEVLTGMAWGPDGLLYVASFGQLPHPAGGGAVVAIAPDGSSSTVVEDLTMVIDVGFDPGGGLLVLQYATPPPGPSGVDAYTDESGTLLHVPDLGTPTDRRVLVEGLDRPTALAVGPDEVLVSVTAGERGGGRGSLRRYPLDELLAASTG